MILKKRGIGRVVPIQREDTEIMPLLSEQNRIEDSGVQVIFLWCSNGIYLKIHPSILTNPTCTLISVLASDLSS